MSYRREDSALAVRDARDTREVFDANVSRSQLLRTVRYELLRRSASVSAEGRTTRSPQRQTLAGRVAAGLIADDLFPRT